MATRTQIWSKLLPRVQQICSVTKVTAHMQVASSMHTVHTEMNCRQISIHGSWSSGSSTCLSVPPFSSLNGGSARDIKALKQYICPTSVGNLSRQSILDIGNLNSKVYHCPTSQIKELFTSLPNCTRQDKQAPAKDNVTWIEARTDLLIKHKRMKKHKLRKVRHRRYVIERRLKIVKDKKKAEKEDKKLNMYKSWAENFDAEEHIKSHLEMARRGGFKIDLTKDLKS